MPKYAKRPDLAEIIRNLQLDVKTMKQKVANLGAQPAGTLGTMYDANVIWNGGFESGLDPGWGFGKTLRGDGRTVDTTDPLTGLNSLRFSDGAFSSSTITWQPSQAEDVIVYKSGIDVFATLPGDTWRLECLFRSSVATSSTRLIACFGATPLACYAMGSVSNAATVAATPMAIASLAGNVTTPAGMSYVTLGINADASPGSATPWKWWLDGVTMRKRLS